MTADLERVRDEAEAHQLPALIHEWSGAPGLRGRIARALRIDLALLEARPELALPCLYRREPFEDTSLMPRPWLRSLRSPADAGTVEEYRTSAEGPIAFSADGSVIGVVGAIAWERATGRLADPRVLVAPSRERRWQHTGDFGTLTLHGGGATFQLNLSRHDYPSIIHELDDTHIVIDTFRDDEGNGDMYLMDVKRRRKLWQRPGCVWGPAARAGDRVVVASTDALTCFSFKRGHELARQPGGGREVAVASDGSVATRSGHLLRVRDLDVSAALPEGTVGWTDAVFSTDGAHLLTGNRLSDTRTGTAIAMLPLDDPKHALVGRPMSPCHHIANGLVYEVMPHGLAAWRTSDGGEAFRVALDLRANGAACWAPDGRWVALAHYRQGLELCDLGARALLARHSLAVARMAFAGERLVVETQDGARLQIGEQLEPWPGELPSTPEIDVPVCDGLVELAGATIPIDDDHAVRSPDRRYLAGRTSHYALDG